MGSYVHLFQVISMHEPDEPYFSSLDIRVAEQFLKHADIDPVFQHMCGKAVAQRVTTNPFVDAGLFR